MSTVIVERTYEAPIDRVWDALTDKNQMKQWYFDVSDFKPEPGFQFEFTGGDENVSYRHFCEIVEVDKPSRLSYTWRYENIEGVSLVTIELFEESKTTTRLKLTHSGLDFKTDDKNFEPSSFNGGWNEIIGNSLRNFVEKSALYKSIVISASPRDVWETILNPNHDWAMAFGGGALAETDWNEGSKIIWTDLSGNIGANGIVEIADREKLLQLRYYDSLNPETSEPLGEYYERFRLTPKDGGVLLEAQAGELQNIHLEAHGKMWDDALQRIRKTAESKSR